MLLVAVAAIIAVWQFEKVPLGAFPMAEQKDASL
jgi:hypothetical protein